MAANNARKNKQITVTLVGFAPMAMAVSARHRASRRPERNSVRGCTKRSARIKRAARGSRRPYAETSVAWRAVTLPLIIISEISIPDLARYSALNLLL